MVISDKDVIKQILEYVKEKRYNQAILIDGEWGAGKTYFVKTKLLKQIKEKMPDKKIYYISLYGVSSPEQIIDEIYSSMIGEFIENKLGENKGRIFEKGIVLTSKLIAAGLKYFNIEKEELPNISDLKDIENSIIVFDDLERCEVEINQTLGVINNLVEHNDIKVILVANQKEIGKMNFSKDLPHKYQTVLDARLMLDENEVKTNLEKTCTKEQLIKRAEQLFFEDTFYKKVKEKLIGLTISYQPDLSDVFVAIIDNYVLGNEAKEYLLTRKQRIVNIFEEKRHYNIRTLIFALIAFDKFDSIIESIENEPREYIEDELDRVLEYVLASSIRIKSGQTLYSWYNSSAKSGIVYYDKNNIRNSCIYGYRFVDDYLFQCKLDEDDIKDTILQRIKENKLYDESIELEKSLQYNKLRSWWKLEDEEIKIALLGMLDELKEMKYGPRYFKDIIVTLLQMEDNGVKDIEWDQFIGLMVKTLNNYTGGFGRSNLEILSDDKELVRNYNEVVRPLIDVIIEKEKRDRQIDNSYLCSLESWDEHFKEKCVENKQTYLTERKFFYYINPDEFILQLQDAKTKNIYDFMDGVERVYDFSGLNAYFSIDFSNIKSILENLKIDKICQDKLTKRIALESLKNKLEEYLKHIEMPIKQV